MDFVLAVEINHVVPSYPCMHMGNIFLLKHMKYLKITQKKNV
jgi:hypothetical protein